MEFPEIRPSGANYVRPSEDEALAISPPGFSWWRAAERGRCEYRVVVKREDVEHYTSPPTSDPIHIPDAAFPAGQYAWHVEAIGPSGDVNAVSTDRSFSITEAAIEQPRADPASLLEHVPSEHPRLLFLGSQLDLVRKTLTTTRAEAFTNLSRMANEAVSIEPIAEPDYDQIRDAAERKLAYHTCFQATRKVHDQGMRALALMYVLTGDRAYGERAKALIVDAAGWNPDAISSILAPYGDEVGLGLLRVGAEVYDWLYDLFTDQERSLVAGMVGARADQMIARLERSDYTYKPEGSHDGRLPGFLLEHAVALAEDERAPGWAGYALRIIATNFPHWAGRDGGWAQGVPYGMAYNGRDAIPFHAWELATGHSVWTKPFYRGLPWFFYYSVSPIGQIMPFGDTEHQPVRPAQARTLLKYHGLRLQDSRLRKWADEVRSDNEEGRVDPFLDILLEDTPIEADNTPLPQDRVFSGVGWATLHSTLSKPSDDFMVMFRSSPFGGVSHGHASQNDFAVMKGGRALICAGGERFPHHGTPFHKEYAQQSISHNCVLVNGQGAVNGDGNRGGEIVSFSTSDRFGYASGEAANAYDSLTRYRRHLLMIRPAILVLIDDLIASEPSTLEWLLHAFEKFEIDPEGQTVTSNRDGASLTGHLYASTSLSLQQTDDWIIQPSEGYPTLTKPQPPKRWHFTAETTPIRRCRIASIFSVHGPGDQEPEIDFSADQDTVSFSFESEGDAYCGRLELTPDHDDLVTILVNDKTEIEISARQN